MTFNGQTFILMNTTETLGLFCMQLNTTAQFVLLLVNVWVTLMQPLSCLHDLAPNHQVLSVSYTDSGLPCDYNRWVEFNIRLNCFGEGIWPAAMNNHFEAALNYQPQTVCTW